MDSQVISIVLELVVAVFCLLAAVQRKRMFAYGFALTFFIYVFYDSARYFSLPVSSEILYFGFFISTVSALFAAILMYVEGYVKIVKVKKKR